MEKKKLLDPDDFSDRLYRLLNIFLFILFITDDGKGKQEASFEEILSDVSYTANFLMDSAVFLLTVDNMRNDIQLREIYHVKNLFVLRNISPMTVTWKAIFETVLQPVSLRRGDFLGAPVIAAGDVSVVTIQMYCMITA